MLEDTQGFDLDYWKTKGVALTDGRNYSLFEEDRNTYFGHWFCLDKGKKAKEFAKESLKYVFNFTEVVKGLTPLKNIPARLMSIQLGFKNYGEISTVTGPMILFIQTKEEFNEFIIRGK